jgi:hypothetical protein
MRRQTIGQKWISNDKETTYLSNCDKSGDRKTCLATVVANVATKRIWLDTTGLNHWFSTVVDQSKNFNHAVTKYYSDKSYDSMKSYLSLCSQSLIITVLNS